MTLSDVSLWIGVGIAGVFAALLIRSAVWKAVGAYNVRKAGPRPLRASHHHLWRDPGPAEELSVVYGPGGAVGAPVAPFTFLEEHDSGSQPCLSVRDARGRRWRIKWGHEARVETFAVRLARACGYFTGTSCRRASSSRCPT
jgi:hypothetical protein